MLTDAALTDLQALRETLAGDLVTPADAGYDAARQAWNLAVDQRPAAVAQVASAQDVQAVVAHAAARGLEVVPQGTGHGAAPLGSLEQALLLRTDRLQEITVDPAARRARIGAGVLARALVDAAAEHGLLTLSGSSHDVGVVGYALGGGLAMVGRTYGLCAERIVDADVVLGDGSLVRASDDPELLWALRGGGSAAGIVVALELELLPVPELHAGQLHFPVERAREVLRAWRDWTTEVDDAVTSNARVIQFPDAPMFPEPVRGQSFAVLEAVVVGTAAEADAALAPLRALGPVLDTVAPSSPQALLDLHGDPPQPVPAFGAGGLLAELPDAAIDALLAQVVGSPLLHAELRHLGGALEQPGAGALGTVGGAYSFMAIGVPMTPELGAAQAGVLRSLAATLGEWGGGRTYGNFAEQGADPEAVWGESTTRLRALRDRVDPGRVVRGMHRL